MFRHNKIQFMVFKGVMTTTTKLDKTNKTTTVDTSNNIVISDQIMLDDAAVDKEVVYHH